MLLFGQCGGRSTAWASATRFRARLVCWKQFKGHVKEKWGRLTDDDLDVINGRRDQLEGKIQSAMASPRTRPERMSTPGSRQCREPPGRLAVGRDLD